MCCRCQFTSGAILIKEQSYFPQFCLMYFIIASFDERFQIKLDFWSTSWQRQTVGEVRRVVFRYLSRVIFGANQSIWHQIDGFIKLIVSSPSPVMDLSVVVFSWRKRNKKTFWLPLNLSRWQTIRLRWQLNLISTSLGRERKCEQFNFKHTKTAPHLSNS